MDSDFKPARGPAKSLQKPTDNPSAETPTPATKTFSTPDETAALDDLKSGILVGSNTEAPKHTALDSKISWQDKLRDKLRIKWPFGKREWLVSAVIVLVCGSIVGFVLTHIGDKPVASATHTKVIKKLPPPPPKTVPSTLTGLQVDPSVNARPVTGIMIENSLDARPQSGLSDAGVVFEAIAEGGITRFLALYQDTAPTDIGPVRSARPYYVQWAMGFDAGYAHVGGSPEALASIKAWGVRDLDQFANSGAYRRISTRYAPHNVYTDMAALNQLETSKGYTSSSFTGFTRRTPKGSAQPTAKAIDMKLSGPLYNIHYDYAPATNTYNRSEGGGAHVDANGNKQISPTVVVGLVVPYSLASDGYHSQYQAIGSGSAYIFQDGLVGQATWTKSSEKSPLVFTDGTGKPFDLNPGQTWVTAVAVPGNVTYAP